jgi:hypothetical protein
MIELSEDIKYIDKLVAKLKKHEAETFMPERDIKQPELYSTLARLFEAKALLVSVQQDAEMSLEDLQSE